MNYQKVYLALIEKRKIVPATEYFEKHHIIPKSFGGSNKKDNIVSLTGREHFVAHCLLARMYGGAMWVAVLRMKNRRGGDGYINSKLYEKARIAWSEWSKNNQVGEKHWAYGKTSKQKGIKKPFFSGEHHPLYGTKRTKSQIEAVVKANKGKKRSDETRQKMSLAQIGEKNHRFGKAITNEHKQKIINYQKSKVVSEATKQKMREAWVARKANSL